MLDLPRIGPIVRDYRDGLGMSRRAKVFATTTILIVATASGPFAIHNRTVGMVVVAIGLVGAAFVIFAVPTRERVLADRADGLTWSRPATVRPRGYSSGTTSLRGEPRAFRAVAFAEAVTYLMLLGIVVIYRLLDGTGPHRRPRADSRHPLPGVLLPRPADPGQPAMGLWRTVGVLVASAIPLGGFWAGWLVEEDERSG